MLWYNRLTRALNKSGVFLLLGAVLMYIGISGEGAASGKEIYILGGGIGSLLCGLIIFIRHFNGAFANEESKKEDFLIKHFVSDDKRKYLSVGALFSLNDYGSVECLKKFYLQTPDEIEGGKRTIEES